MRKTSRVRLAIAAGLAIATFAAAIAPVTAYAGYAGYSDLYEDHWAVREGVVAWSEKNGVVDGYEDGTWGAERAVDRATAAEILYKLAGCPRVTSRPAFADADSLSWAADSVAWAQQMGIFSGNVHADGSVTFDPWSPLTREQAAKVLRVIARAQSVNPSVLSGYGDRSSIAAWAAGSVAWAVDNDIMGKGGSLNGGGTCSRAEFVSMLKSTDERVRFDDDYWDDRFDDRDDDWDDDELWEDAWDEDRWDDDDDDRYDDDDDDDRYDDDWDDDRYDDDDDWDDDRWDDDDDDRWDD